ncbi:helix-turn-helix transcriptional regulator [Streptomyces sp. NPDC001941]|uniref:helix-turn-helix domain-containing protein n=1 Tax=Streptomyces sp. NPDC001941 TaxID=3154659 RepID=UPI00331B1307
MTLALWLRAQRRRSGLTYQQMASRTGHLVTATVLSRAAAGAPVPTWRTVQAYAVACEADQGRARELWKAARHARQRTLSQEAAEDEDRQDLDLVDRLNRALSHPEFVDNFAQLRRAMVQLRAREGQPSLAELQRRAGPGPDGKPVLPKSSLSAFLSGQTVPLRRHITALTRALGASEWKVAEWERAWDRISGQRPIPPRPTRPRPGAASGPGGRTSGPRTRTDARALPRAADPAQRTPPRAEAAPRRVGGPQKALSSGGLTPAGLPMRRPRQRSGDQEWYVTYRAYPTPAGQSAADRPGHGGPIVLTIPPWTDPHGAEIALRAAARERKAMRDRNFAPSGE